MSRSRRGSTAHLSGLAAEEAVARVYEGRGAIIETTRWRAPRALGGGELDLVAREGGTLVFVEVKAGRAAASRDAIGAAQWRRLEAAARAYMVQHEAGADGCRFDAAFVSVDGSVAIVENARGFDEW